MQDLCEMEREGSGAEWGSRLARAQVVFKIVCLHCILHLFLVLYFCILYILYIHMVTIIYLFQAFYQNAYDSKLWAGDCFKFDSSDRGEKVREIS